ncbi:hypothetical protein [Streptomyces stelliscabiei]|uniref:Uncharacterized protein n=1 Tax=Streptomyces stelliscabiei TaxID=146820 RepID=A0A8I0TQX3_9ACTN|nr:hypothetical protein [Streptomyces stelliscabiei]KND40490.1 hypothetical protein IQ64_34595 [Streptomyces stelliscabiei]MBE1594668.1 hypothetical protein [Streptomyces stelliscabiei]MDX2521143.1 hypothetical protein [Streptomyces stelliscabiei]MDX2550810.1 hypothetical protein [Streptomyces stelliscabiei]MDX2616807.1 hypothetical protein [Streptomyces stelliscabiei]
MTLTAFAAETEERFALARQVADAVLFEGYVLYPYRASSAKNRLRWQFGVLVPPGWGAECEEHDFQHTECLMEPKAGATLSVEMRFLHARRRTVQRIRPDGGFDTVTELDLDDRVLVPWDEGFEERVEVIAPVDALLGDGVTHPFRLPAREDTAPVLDAAGRTVGRLLRRCEAVSGTVRLSARELDGPYRTLRLTAVVENTSDWTPPEGHAADRDAALPHSLVATHLLMALSAGSFLSMTDPPEWAKGAVAACRNLHTWPVLAGEPGRADLVLSSPIILEDHPAIAPESPGALYDATEIDEILALRTAALTDEEKREARGTDERAAAVIELAESMPAEVLERLHGAVRSLREVTAGPGPADPGVGFPDEFGVGRPDTPWWDPASDAGFDPARDRVVVAGRSVGQGSRVELHPGLRHTDAQDIFLRGRTAVVEAVLHDVDGGVHLAVTVEGDPGADIRREQGRFLYFQPDEVTPLEDGA